jgi:L-2-hydroxyglutarate oxidase LhgO
MSISQKNYDYVVVGAGTMGLSTALYLTLQSPDAQIALVEQYHFGH